MRAVVQRVARAEVHVEAQRVGEIGRGLLVLLGVHRADDTVSADWLCDKILHLRIFENEAGKFDRSLLEIGGELLVVSQFTLLADASKGRRPSFSEAAEPSKARALYEYFVERVRVAGVRCATGCFGARMAVSLVNDGPVTVVLDSPSP